MSHIYTSADQLIGKTPLLELSNIEKEEKLEEKANDVATGDIYDSAPEKKGNKTGDKVAEEAVDRACHWLAVATGNMINTCSPDLVIFGGGVIEAVGDLFLEKILAEVDRYCMPTIRTTVDIKNASLGDDSVLYGDLAMIEEGEG